MPSSGWPANCRAVRRVPRRLELSLALQFKWRTTSELLSRTELAAYESKIGLTDLLISNYYRKLNIVSALLTEKAPKLNYTRNYYNMLEPEIDPDHVDPLGALTGIVEADHVRRWAKTKSPQYQEFKEERASRFPFREDINRKVALW